MIFLKRFIDYSIFSAAILLVFLLVFEQYLKVPGLVKWIGHWHPLILHFPIALIFVTILQYWRKDAHFEWYLSITTLLTLITAITGFLLSLESESKGDLITVHQWLGVTISYLIAFWYWLNGMRILRGISPILLQSAMIILIVLTGHFGGMVTHGENFLTFGPDKKDQVNRILPEDPNVFHDIIQPILDEKCISCHNPDKSKGALILTDFTSILKGGESGKTIDLQDHTNSLLLKRISLPIDHEEHMPPKEESQLTEDERILLSEWIETGGSDGLHFSNLEKEGQSYSLIKKLIENNRNIKWSELPGVSEDKLTDNSTDYVRISRLYYGSDELQVIIYPHKNYNTSIIKDLKRLSKNIIELNLNGLPLNEGELEIIASFVNLEKLNISNTDINDADIRSLEKLKKLRELKIYNTAITNEAFKTFNALQELTSLLVYNTDITEEGLDNFRSENGDVMVINAAKLTEEFRSELPSPIVEPRK